MRRKNRPEPSSPLVAGTTERLAAIVEAAERAAVAVIDDAEAQARERLEQAEAEADRIAAERLAALSDLTDALVAQAESIREQSEQLLSSLAEAQRRLADETDGAAKAEPRGERARSPHLTAVAPIEKSQDGNEAGAKRERADGGSSAGARLLATQMAVSGSSREEIETRLRDGFEIDDAAAILDAILGPEEN